MTRNEFIAQAAIQERHIAALYALKSSLLTPMQRMEDSIRDAIHYADALEAAGVAPWGEGEADAED